MNIFTLALPATLFAIIGALIVVFVLRQVLSAALGDIRGFGTRFVKKRRLKKLTKVDELIEKKLLMEASHLLRECFCIDKYIVSSDEVKLNLNYNLGVLGRLMVISDKSGQRLANLGIIEELFQSRAELAMKAFGIIETWEAIRTSRNQAGKNLPSWSSLEFKKRLEEVEDKLKTNEQTLIAQLKEAFLCIESAQPTEPITYH